MKENKEIREDTRQKKSNNVRKYKNNLIKADEQERQLPSIAVNLMKIKRILCLK